MSFHLGSPVRGCRGLLPGLVVMLLVAFASACVRLPESGPVSMVGGADPANRRQVGYLPGPPPPGAGADEVVDGFLDAMTASPPQPTVAREYLAAGARERWQPGPRVVVYDGASTPTGQGRVVVRLNEAYQLFGSGIYRGELSAGERSLTFPMQLEGGEWRIADAPNALIVPQTWIDANYVRQSVYYLDRTNQILVPEPVLVPRDEQLPGSLLRSVFSAPPEGLERVEGTALPVQTQGIPQFSLDRDGVVDLGLTERIATERAAELATAQLTWTLRQDSGISGLRISSTAGPLPDMAGIIGMSQGDLFDPTDVSAGDTLYALREGRLVAGRLTAMDPVAGPFGQREDYGLRSFAVSLDSDQVAGVGFDGRILLTQTRDPGADVSTEMVGVGAVPRPAWDHLDRLWVVDHPAGRARMRVFQDDRIRTVNIPSLSGRRVQSFLVSRDGTRIVAVVRGARQDRILSGRIETNARGRVIGVIRMHELVWPNQERPRIRALAWRGTTQVSVLSRVGDVVQVRPMNVDGLPMGLGEDVATLGPQFRWLTGSPVEGEDAYLGARQGVSRLASVDRTLGPVAGDPQTLSYVG